MEKQHLTPAECWDDFWEWYKGQRPARMPNELAVADLTHRGEVKKTNRKGKVVVVRLGAERIARLLDKYAKGRYKFHEGSPYFTMQ